MTRIVRHGDPQPDGVYALLAEHGVICQLMQGRWQHGNTRSTWAELTAVEDEVFVVVDLPEHPSPVWTPAQRAAAPAQPATRVVEVNLPESQQEVSL